MFRVRTGDRSQSMTAAGFANVDRVKIEVEGHYTIEVYWHRAVPLFGLQMTRCLGDARLKNIVSTEPETGRVKLGPKSWVLLGTDGLYRGHEETASQAARLASLVRKGARAADL